MKKLVCLLAVLAFASPLYAAQDPNEMVAFDLTVDGNKLTISYQCQWKVTEVPKLTDTTPPAALGLLVEVISGDAELIGSSDYSPDFLVYPDYIYSLPDPPGDPGDPNIDEYAIGMGHPVADAAAAGVQNLDYDNEITSAAVCMGRIIDGTPGPMPVAPNQADLVTLAFKGKGTADVQVSADTLRGGVVGSQLDTNLPQTVTVAACKGCIGQPLGDVNGDGTVTSFDKLLQRFANGSVPGDSNWNPCADMNDDDKVTSFDKLLMRFNNGVTVEPGGCP